MNAHSCNREKSRYAQSNVGGIPERISLRVRNEIFKWLMRQAGVKSTTIVLDVGVTSDSRGDSNFFEKLYPYPQNITAVGTEDANFLESDFPGLRFIKADGTRLPFPDGYFDLAVSFATIEHVGNRIRQSMFVNELCRVSKSCCIVTPNRLYPLEFHTILPFVHWLPRPCFRFFANVFGKAFFAEEENLNLLTITELLKMFPKEIKITTCHYRLFGWISHIVVYATVN